MFGIKSFNNPNLVQQVILLLVLCILTIFKTPQLFRKASNIGRVDQTSNRLSFLSPGEKSDEKDKKKTLFGNSSSRDASPTPAKREDQVGVLFVFNQCQPLAFMQITGHRNGATLARYTLLQRSLKHCNQSYHFWAALIIHHFWQTMTINKLYTSHIPIQIHVHKNFYTISIFLSGKTFQKGKLN